MSCCLRTKQPHLQEAFRCAFPCSSASLQLVRYRCRKCRQLVATEHNTIPTIGVGRRVFRRQRYQQQQQQQQGQADAESAAAAAAASGGLEQGSVFLEPMAWMVDQVVGPVQGKLYCTKCQARLGSFNWAGERA